jgi:hypothetical protein
MALSRKPPALYMDGRGAGVVYFLGTFLPTFLADFLVYLASGMASVSKHAKAPPAKAAADAPPGGKAAAGKAT